MHIHTHVNIKLRITAEQADVQTAVDTKAVSTTLSFKPSQAGGSCLKSLEMEYNDD